MVLKHALEHSSEYSFLSYLPYEFYPGKIGEGTVFDEHLGSISHGNPAIHKRIFQWIGYCISDLPNVKKIALLIGERDSGKTTLARLISMIVGEKNCQTFSFDHITRFSNDERFGKKSDSALI